MISGPGCGGSMFGGSGEPGRGISAIKVLRLLINDGPRRRANAGRAGRCGCPRPHSDMSSGRLYFVPLTIWRGSVFRAMKFSWIGLPAFVPTTGERRPALKGSRVSWRDQGECNQWPPHWFCEQTMRRITP
jgi:hypothetical protein